MALKAVFFDVGETIVDEERWWREMADAAGVGPHVIWAALGVTIARGEEHFSLWEHLGIERPDAWNGIVYSLDDLYPDAADCLAALRATGLSVGLAGNQNWGLEEWARSADAARSTWSPARPASACASRIPRSSGRSSSCSGYDADEVAYVGDRVDNDVRPAAAAGLVAIHVRRGPWGRLQEPSADAALVLDDLASLPEALASLA